VSFFGRNLTLVAAYQKPQNEYFLNFGLSTSFIANNQKPLLLIAIWYALLALTFLWLEIAAN
jgi:hypothetical protein